ncbi:MAG TPA: hypothetical protein EYQ53_04965 [Candidatus Poseidoniales archaeon]|nr:MAG: hypothetical protein CXT69_01890 [Euryarchaeota archaeon]HIG03713.1 hypothetical protein [Candidatus Poseidoniales archaeon]HIK78133.1 hypothetical protein [Candidatus Poseidoniales archaeon]
MEWVQPPENSLESLRQGLIDFDGVEFDLRLTKDGGVIIHHDAKVSTCEEVRSGLESPWVEKNSLDDLCALGFTSFENFLANKDVLMRLNEQAAMICVELKPPHPSSGASGGWLASGKQRAQMKKLVMAAEEKLSEYSVSIQNSVYYAFFKGLPAITTKAKIHRPASILWPIIPRFGGRTFKRTVCIPQYLTTPLSRLIRKQRANNSPMVPCALEYFIPPTNKLPLGSSVGLKGKQLQKLRQATGGFPIYVWPGKLYLEAELINAGITPLTDNADPSIHTLPCGSARWKKPANLPLSDEWINHFSSSAQEEHEKLISQAYSELTPWHEMNYSEQKNVVTLWRNRYEWKKSIDELMESCSTSTMPWEAVRLIGHRGCGKSQRPIY